MFKELLFSEIEEHYKQFAHVRAQVLTPDEFKNELRGSIINFQRQLLPYLDQSREQEYKKIVEDEANGNGSFNQTLKTYNALQQQLASMTDRRKQAVKADFLDRSRFLIFRMLTAIGIATVILATGYLAHKWGIPLPLLRIPT